MTYLFAIFALNVRDALIIVDEPELHLHPKWQKTLLLLFIQLAEATGNQFLLATHSPMFVSPDSIQFVSRVFSSQQHSHILRLDTARLPENKHLLNIVNSQNNERIFFADQVVLVEGLSDRIFFEAILDQHGRSANRSSILEVVSVGGKYLFDAYCKILDACQIPYAIIADLDYLEQIGSGEIKALFRTDAKDIKKGVIDDVGSVDGATLVAAIEEAIANGNWDHAKELWEYIKSRRRKVRPDLTEAETRLLHDFIEKKYSERVYVLSLGALEAYLPLGHGSKDLEKLIRLLAEDASWDKLPEKGKEELARIAKQLLDSKDSTGGAAPGRL